MESQWNHSGVIQKTFIMRVNQQSKHKLYTKTHESGASREVMLSAVTSMTFHLSARFEVLTSILQRIHTRSNKFTQSVLFYYKVLFKSTILSHRLLSK